MSDRNRVAVALASLAVLGAASGCSGPDRPEVVDGGSVAATCAAAVEAAFPGGDGGTLVAYRAAVRRCASLEELSDRAAFDGSILRLDCAPADILALAGTIPQLGRGVPAAPADLADTGVCRQFNAECADYDELRRDHAAVTQNPTVANQGLYVHHRQLFDTCTRKYGTGDKRN